VTQNPIVVPTVYPPRLHLSSKLKRRLSSIHTALFCADNLIKLHDSVPVVRMWHDMRADPILRSLDDPEWLNSEYLHASAVPEFVSWLMV
jgi:hypothetical protein